MFFVRYGVHFNIRWMHSAGLQPALRSREDLLVGFHKQVVAHFPDQAARVLAGVRWNRLVMRTVAAGNLKLDT